MTNLSNQILNEIHDNEKFIKVQISRIKSLEENSRRFKKSRHHIADNNTNFNT